MRKYLFIAVLLVSNYLVDAQKVEFKNGIIQVEGKDWAKMTVDKRNFGLTKEFTVFSLSGEKLIIAAPATEFEADKSDNTILYYRLTFLTSNQVGIFKVSAMGQEKSFVKMIGTSGIIINDKTDDTKVKEFIAMRSASPVIAVDYTVVYRDKTWPVRLQEDHNIEQQSKIIGSFRSKGSYNGLDSYEFMLPSGVLVAKVSFAGGNNAQNFEAFTAKDNIKRVIPIPQEGKIIAASAGIDKNQFALARMVKWLVDNEYL
jgi:hypothetical protein